MRVAIVASGSQGNATLFESNGVCILVDGGIGPSALKRKMAECGFGTRLDAIVITHAHLDHVGECKRLAANWKIPVYASESTARTANLGERRDVRVFGARTPFAIKSLTVSPLPLPHDVAQVCLAVSDGTHSAAIATDLGEIPPALGEHVAGCDVLLLESNYDPVLLEQGPYPEFLKKRIRSARGHLSNGQACELLRRLSPRTHTVVLMHMSEKNNRTDLALHSARSAIRRKGVRVFAARQDDARVITVDAQVRRVPEQLSLGLFAAACAG